MEVRRSRNPPRLPLASLSTCCGEADFYAGYIEANIGVEESSRHEADTYPPNSRMNPRDEIEIRRRLKSTGAFYAFQTARASFGDLGEMTFEQAGMLVGYMYHQGILDRYAGIDAITDHYAGVDAAIDHALAAHGCDP